MAAILIAILLTESVVADQGLASREYKAAIVLKGAKVKTDTYSATPLRHQNNVNSPSCIVLKKTATTATCGLTIFSCATILLD